MTRRTIRAIPFDWGGTLMQVLDHPGPMADWPEVALVPGVDHALLCLHDTYLLAVATNAADSNASLVRSALDRVHVARYFDQVFTARELGVAKKAGLGTVGTSPETDPYRPGQAATVTIS